MYPPRSWKNCIRKLQVQVHSAPTTISPSILPRSLPHPIRSEANLRNHIISLVNISVTLKERLHQVLVAACRSLFAAWALPHDQYAIPIILNPQSLILRAYFKVRYQILQMRKLKIKEVKELAQATQLMGGRERCEAFSCLSWPGLISPPRSLFMPNPYLGPSHHGTSHIWKWYQSSSLGPSHHDTFHMWKCYQSYSPRKIW